MNICLFLKRDSLRVFEDATFEEDGYAIIGFINTQHDLEFTIYEAFDGGSVPLKDIKRSKEEFEDLLEVELSDFLSRKMTNFML